MLPLCITSLERRTTVHSRKVKTVNNLSSNSSRLTLKTQDGSRPFYYCTLYMNFTTRLQNTPEHKILRHNYKIFCGRATFLPSIWDVKCGLFPHIGPLALAVYTSRYLSFSYLFPQQTTPREFIRPHRHAYYKMWPIVTGMCVCLVSLC